MGFSIRWAKNHEIIIGSCNSEKAKQGAEKVKHILGGTSRICGTDNASAIEIGNVVVLCVPFEHMAAVTSDMRNSHQVVISPIVPMVFNGRYFEFVPP